MKYLPTRIFVEPLLQLSMLVLIVAFLPPHLANAQPENIRFDHLSSDQGLSQNSVLCISQDRNGFMWFGTYEGLNRFDGYEFKIYKSEIKNPYSLSNNSVQCLFEDHNGILWIGTDGGLNRFDRAKDGFIHYMYDPNDSNSLSSNRIRWICEDRFGALWIGTSGGGLNQLDSERKHFIRYQNNPHDPYSISQNIVSCTFVDKSGNLWVATDGGLNRFDQTRNRFIRYRHDPANPHSLSENFAYRIFEDRSGILWIGLWNGGLDQYNREKDQFIHYKNRPENSFSLSSNIVRSIYEDRTGCLWVGTWGGGLNKFDRIHKRFIRYQSNPINPNSLSNNSVLSIYEDRSGLLWIGNEFGGINKFDRGKIKFTHYKMEPDNSNSLNNNTIYSISETIDKGKKTLWIGTQSGGLNRYEQEKNKFTSFKSNPNNPLSLSDNNIRVILESRTGVLWIGTNRGLNQFDRVKETSTRYFHDPNNPNSLSNNDVFSICEDRSGSVWVGTYGGGLNKFDPKTKKFTRFMNDPGNPNSISDNFIWSIIEDRSGILWIGTENGGLNQCGRDGNQFIHYQADRKDPAGISSNKILSIHEDQSGMLWIGTTEGLNKFDKGNKRFSRYQLTDGLPSNTIQSILEDEHGNLWLGTQKGLSKFDPQTNTFKNFNVSDGLQGNEFSVNACFRNRHGDMYFGGINGFNTFFPDSIKDNPYIPSIVIKDFQIFNKSVPVGEKNDGTVVLEKSIIETQEISLTYKENTFSFEFAALHLASPEQNKYAYMMEGFDKGWNYTDARRRFAMYANMNGGEYVFHVKGSNSDGIWNEEGATIRVMITPPFWLTLWFRFLLAAMVTGVIFWIYKWLVQTRDLAAQRRMEAALTQERNLLRTLINHLPDGIYVKDTDCRKTIANLADVHTMGLQSETEAIGKKDSDLYPKDVADRFSADDQSVIQNGLPVINREEYVLDEQGKKRWLVTTKLPLRDNNGQIIGLVGIGRDITEQKKAQESLQHERNILRTLIDNLPDMIFFKDAEGRYILDNLSHLRSIGMKHQEEIIGKTTFDFNPPELAKLYMEDEKHVIESRQPMIEKEERAVHRETGEQRWHLTSKVPLIDTQGNVTGIVGIARDITERKQAEAERERLIKELQNALADIKVLSGLVPICSSCKKIRDDKGYWTQLEGYIQEHSQAKFSHGVCPDCMKRLYPNFGQKKIE
jgi:PAS domain S-box-containing protein